MRSAEREAGTKRPARKLAPALPFPKHRPKETISVLRFRALPVLCDDGQDHGKRSMHAIGGLESTSELPNDRPFAIKELPAIRAVPHLQPVAGREGGNGAMHGMTRPLVSRKTENDISQAESPIAAGEMCGWRWKCARCSVISTSRSNGTGIQCYFKGNSACASARTRWSRSQPQVADRRPRDADDCAGLDALQWRPSAGPRNRAAAQGPAVA